MIRFNYILDKLGIEYERQDINKKVIRYWCTYAFDYKIKLPFCIIIDKNYNTFSLFSPTITKVNDEKRCEVLEKINLINSNLVYGLLCLDEDDELIYYMGASIEGETNPINAEQVEDYVKCMLSALRKVTVEFEGANELIYQKDLVAIDLDEGDSVESK